MSICIHAFLTRICATGPHKETRRDPALPAPSSSLSASTGSAAGTPTDPYSHGYVPGNKFFRSIRQRAASSLFSHRAILPALADGKAAAASARCKGNPARAPRLLRKFRALETASCADGRRPTGQACWRHHSVESAFSRKLVRAISTSTASDSSSSAYPSRAYLSPQYGFMPSQR